MLLGFSWYVVPTPLSHNQVTRVQNYCTGVVCSFTSSLTYSLIISRAVTSRRPIHTTATAESTTSAYFMRNAFAHSIRLDTEDKHTRSGVA